MSVAEENLSSGFRVRGTGQGLQTQVTATGARDRSLGDLYSRGKVGDTGFLTSVRRRGGPLVAPR